METVTFGFVILYFTLLGVAPLCCGDYTRTINIDKHYGNDTRCLVDSKLEGTTTATCRTLMAAFQIPRQSSTQYVLSNGVHVLNESVATFVDLNNIAFVGNGSNVSIDCNGSGNVGFAFVDITDIEFTNIAFFNCFALRNSTSKDFNVENGPFSLSQFYVGLYFYHCQNVLMTQVHITNCSMGAVMFNTDGNNQIKSSNFTGNVFLPEHNDSLVFGGGGGFYIEMSYCVPGDTRCGGEHVISYESRNSHSHYSFEDCVFSGNKATTSGKQTYVIPYRANHTAFGRGGGLLIYLKGNATENTFDITSCQFESNHAVWGGGMLIEFQDTASNNTVNVQKSTFTNNSCYFTAESGTGGGGLRIAHYIYGINRSPDDPIPLIKQGNIISVHKCDFTNNSALNGGGLSISAALQNYGSKDVANITIKNCNFSRNVAKLGAALHVDRFSVITQGHMLQVTVHDSEFEHNSVYFTQLLNEPGMPHEAGLGTVYTHEVKIVFQGDVGMSYNKGTALAAIGAPVDFTKCHTLFQQNIGTKGGGIALLGSGYIQIGDNTTMVFNNNSATIHGGGIYNQYIAKENLKSYTDCFIRHTDPFLKPEKWGANFIFANNTDQVGNRPSAIHTTSILPCSFTEASDTNRIFCWDNWEYLIFSCTESITSDIGSITFSGEGESQNTVKAFPGMPFHLPMTILDDRGLKIGDESIFSASTNTTKAAVGNANMNFAFVQGESTNVRGSVNQPVILQMDNLGDRVWHVEVVVELQPCPPGFKANTSGIFYNNDTYEPEDTFCDCSNHYGEAVICDSEAFFAGLRNGNWLGNLTKNGTYYSAVCPPGYCHVSKESTSFYRLPNNSKDLDKLVCGSKNRKGILCGECVDGFGPAVNSLTYECVNCTDENIAANVSKYIASIYIPLSIMFITLIIFDIRLTTGPANAFILYCQVVASTFDLNADGQIPLKLLTKHSGKLLKAYQVPYGIFNLEFIENFLPPLCLGTHLNNLSVFLLDYAVAVFPLLMIIAVVIYVRIHVCLAPKCCRGKKSRAWERVTSMSLSMSVAISQSGKQRKGISEAVLPAFAAFVLLSYTKFTLASSYILSYRRLIDENGHTIKETPRVYYAGQFSYNERSYVFPYFLPACIILVTVVSITPILLLDYPLRVFEWCIGKVDCMWKRYPVDKIHVLLDTFQGCYKNKMRFFAGLYFLFRLAINVSYLAIDTWLDQFIVQQIACIVMVVLLAICRPYNNENYLFNYVDTLIFLNLAAVNALSLYMYAYAQSYPNTAPSSSAFAVQYILVFLPLVFMICYILWNVTRPYHQEIKHAIRETSSAIFRRLRLGGASSAGYERLSSVPGNNTPGSPIATNIYINAGERDEDDDETIEAMFARAERENTYRPSPVQFSEEKVVHHYGSTGDSGSGGSGSSSNNTGDSSYGVASSVSLKPTQTLIEISDKVNRTD